MLYKGNILMEISFDFIEHLWFPCFQRSNCAIVKYFQKYSLQIHILTAAFHTFKFKGYGRKRNIPISEGRNSW